MAAIEWVMRVMKSEKNLPNFFELPKKSHFVSRLADYWQTGPRQVKFRLHAPTDEIATVQSMAANNPFDCLSDDYQKRLDDKAARDAIMASKVQLQVQF